MRDEYQSLSEVIKQRENHGKGDKYPDRKWIV